MAKKISLTKIIEWGTYLLVFLLPWQTRLIYRAASLNGGYWEYGSNSLYLTEILLWLLVVLFLVYLKKNKIRFNSERFNFLLVGLLAWSLLTAVWALDWNLAIYYWSILVTGFLLYFLVSHGPVDRIKILISLIMAAVVQSLLAIYQFLTQSIFASKWLGLAGHSPLDLGVFVVEYGPERWLRAYGSLPHPNMLAAFLVVALIAVLGLSLIADSRLKRLFVGLSWIAMIPALLFTFSRGAWLAFSVCYLSFIIWMIVKKIKKGVTIQMLILGVVLAAILATIFWHPVAARVLGEQRLELLSNQERLTLYGQSAVVIKDSWYSGVGLNNYTLAVFEKINNSWPIWAYQPVHNVYVLVLAELGIIGLLLYLAILGYLLFARNRGIVGKLALVALLIMGLFDHFLWSLYFGVMLWWLVVGLARK